MSIPKVLIGFSDFRDDDLDTKAAAIINGMTGNVNYPAPVPDLPTVQVALDEYEAALAAAKNGSVEATALKDQKRQKLELLLKQLGAYVQANCKNDLAILLGSGFSANKPNAPIGMLPKPINFKVENGPNSGTLKLSLDKITGANSYLFEFTPAPITATSSWAVKVGTARTYIIESLTSGQQYAFRVAGVGADPTIVYSDVITRFVQ